MIPNVDVELVSTFDINETLTTKTYFLDFEKGKIENFITEKEALKQAIFKILNTERYEYLIYSWDYGIELNDLYGQPLSFVLPELKRRITEALTQDDRIESVDAFYFEVRKGKVYAEFTVYSIYGEIRETKVVSI